MTAWNYILDMKILYNTHLSPKRWGFIIRERCWNQYLTLKQADVGQKPVKKMLHRCWWHSDHVTIKIWSTYCMLHTPWIPVPTCSLLHAYWTVTSISKLSPKYFVAINIVWFFIRILFKIISFHHSFQKDKHCSWKMDVAFQTSFPCKDFQIDAYSEILSTNQNLCINLKTDLGFV